VNKIDKKLYQQAINGPYGVPSGHSENFLRAVRAIPRELYYARLNAAQKWIELFFDENNYTTRFNYKCKHVEPFETKSDGAILHVSYEDLSDEGELQWTKLYVRGDDAIDILDGLYGLEDDLY
jgi:hypothetical protein